MIVKLRQKLAQEIVETVKSVCGQDINFIDEAGMILASTNKERIGTYHEIGYQVAQTGRRMEVETNDSFYGTMRGINLPVYYHRVLIAVIGITGKPQEVRKYAQLAERVTLLLIRERELEAFSYAQAAKKHYAIDVLLRQEVDNRTYLNDVLREFQVNLNTKKRLLLLRTAVGESDTVLSNLEEQVKSLFQMSGITLHSFTYPNEFRAVIDSELFEKNAYMFRSFVEQQKGQVRIAVGKQCLLYHLSSSHETALAAWQVMEDQGTYYILFDDLTLELVLSAMSGETKREFLFKTVEPLSAKEREILSVYFREDMSLARASEKLFIHKNTLQYQLNHIQELCGLNPRKFRDAVQLYLAVQMIKE